jgi:hypothetical protein
MLKPKSPQTSFYGSYLYDRIIPQDHPLRKSNQVVNLPPPGGHSAGPARKHRFYFAPAVEGIEYHQPPVQTIPSLKYQRYCYWHVNGCIIKQIWHFL